MSMYIEYKKKLTTNFRVEEDLRRKVKKKSHSRTVFKNSKYSRVASRSVLPERTP